MDDEIADIIFIDGEDTPRPVLGELWVPSVGTSHLFLNGTPDTPHIDRPFHAEWVVEGDRLLLARFERARDVHEVVRTNGSGRARSYRQFLRGGDDPRRPAPPTGGELAHWLSGTVRIADGPSVESDGNDEPPFRLREVRAYAAVLELEVTAGIVRSRRRVEASPGMGFDTPSQVSKPPRAPEPGPSLERCGEPSNARNPLRGAPQRATFQDKALRERIAREREAGDVDLARAPLFDRLLSELERVDATRRARVVASICDGLSITSEELAAYDRRDEQEWRAAWEAWADSPSTPVLWVIRSPRLYEAPSAARRTPEALVAWAAKCAQEERCDVVLIPDRRTRVFVDSAGAVVARTTITPGWEERARPSDG